MMPRPRIVPVGVAGGEAVRKTRAAPGTG
jgi:hypothetical protein